MGAMGAMNRAATDRQLNVYQERYCMSDQGNQSNSPAQPPKGAPVPAVTQSGAAQPPEAASGPRGVAPVGAGPTAHPPGSAPSAVPASESRDSSQTGESSGST